MNTCTLTCTTMSKNAHGSNGKCCRKSTTVKMVEIEKLVQCWKVEMQSTKRESSREEQRAGEKGNTAAATAAAVERNYRIIDREMHGQRERKETKEYCSKQTELLFYPLHFHFLCTKLKKTTNEVWATEPNSTTLH